MTTLRQLVHGRVDRADRRLLDRVGRLVSERTREWMYVFNPSVSGTDLYVKVVLRGDCVVISFHGQEDSDEDE